MESLLRIHYMQQWFTLSDPAMEEALHDTPPSRDFAGLGCWDCWLHDESTILRCRLVLETRPLPERILATVNLLLGAIGIMLHIGVDTESGQAHTVRGTAGHVNDVIVANSLLHGQETDVFADACDMGAHKRPDAKEDLKWCVTMRPGLRKLLDKADLMDALTEQVEHIKASIRAKVELPFRVDKRQFGHMKVRYRSMAKNTTQLQTLFAPANLWIVRKRLSGTLA